ncbi:DUF418 domain-containing protein [Rhodoferax sp. AJA081-3]|uniref:DUF418 domain-containing protein n=1 Tax=Rhodoferax sp. AJA081-3 TaxID=2752316 RepID=UPI001BB5A44C|nr:DUF418 domain-containing protein [Rhodoferax sp. AJA081-3]QTN28048.1 DUF418 domain-containing protein [Rhodoferax sp. AJA081-3]
MQADTVPTDTMPPPAAARAPAIAQTRIESLDVVRGFALFGIFLMNIEFFNRTMSGIGEGMPQGLTGVDWWASWFVTYFVQGKFWTVFSLLFGMGFAVMLTRAERAQRDFLAPYLRRILGLAVFGAAHYIFLWQGDILFSYSVGAVALMIVLYGKWKPILIALAVMVGLGLAGMEPLFGIAGAVAFVALVSLYLRNEQTFTVRGRAIPRFSMILGVLGVVAVVAAAVLWVLPDGPKEPRIPVTLFGVILLVVAKLSARFKDPKDLRVLRLGATLYTVSFVIMTTLGAAQYLMPRPPEVAANATQAEVEKAEKKKAEKATRLAERLEARRKEVQTLSSGTYWEAVEMRARRFPDKVAGDAGFATVLLAMFLIGSWFVRSGVMENTKAHLPLFRKLALYGLPLGIGLGLLGSTITMSHTPGDSQSGFQFARGLAMLGNLPASLGYVGLVVLMLHSRSVFSHIRVLAPVGRMALSNYLLQSLICSWYFYGYGLGNWGMGRATQLGFVLVVFVLQIGLSHWWLSRYRFGPLEWVWRAFTYRSTPAMLK